jgi:hypothetical protein
MDVQSALPVRVESMRLIKEESLGRLGVFGGAHPVLSADLVGRKASADL